MQTVSLEEAKIEPEAARTESAKRCGPALRCCPGSVRRGSNLLTSPPAIRRNLSDPRPNCGPFYGLSIRVVFANRRERVATIDPTKILRQTKRRVSKKTSRTNLASNEGPQGGI